MTMHVLSMNNHRLGRHILIHGVESWSGVEPWSGVVFLELVFWSQCKSFKVRDDWPFCDSNDTLNELR